ncbi:unnamed protein product [Linum trigynum]|uniref:Uncharacterized protein n=1 Tax=Linum trigynum TaxID=586398 RepID=A0AAV2F8Q5_9ROSI
MGANGIKLVDVFVHSKEEEARFAYFEILATTELGLSSDMDFDLEGSDASVNFASMLRGDPTTLLANSKWSTTEGSGASNA